MLPSAAVYRFPWELTSGALHDGDSLRTFGKLVRYDPEESRATLSVHHSSKEHCVTVQTVFVEPFQAIIGAQYVVLGELEDVDGAGPVVRARVLNCVDGANLALLQRAICDHRRFLDERKTTREHTESADNRN
ncbi:CST complex subunit TEN1 [Eucyclogobius newberryi]|uniref:CST complex subunit TEN1 n=1 Tax=Eucyclogobius newberryi TaxID=166745 RepID=UPI003B5CB28F